MNRKYVIAGLALLIVGSGLGGFAFLNSDTTIDDLNNTVVSQEEVGEDFEKTHETFANSSAFDNQLISLRVDRRFADDNGTVVLSSATVYSSEEVAEKVKISFIERTADNVTSADFGNGEIVKLYQDALLKDVVYFYRQKGDKIYFVSVASIQGYKEEKARALMKEMEPAGFFSRIIG